jgi:hypothetical protein
MNATKFVPSSVLRNAIVLSFPLLASSGCYVTPVGQGPDHAQQYAYSPAPVAPVPGAHSTHTVVVSGRPTQATLAVKLFPSNVLADQTGVLTMQVAILMIGSGRFTVDYQGETLVGEATRVSNDDRRGVASAYGQHGMIARCEYQMSSPRTGGTCAFANGARYQLQVGS